MEYLCQNNFSPVNIHYNLTGIRAHVITHNLDTSPFQNQQLQFYDKSMKLNGPPKPKPHTYIDIDLLTSLVSLCEAFYDTLVYERLLVVAYFVFLRLSNVLPDTVTSFDPTRQLTRGDVILLRCYCINKSGTSYQPLFGSLGLMV